jgi:hypothetical protein
MKKFLVLLQTYGLALLVALTVVAFTLALVEGLEQSVNELSIITFVTTIQDILLSDAVESEGWTRLMHSLLIISLGWAAVKIYIKTVGLKWDTFMARYVVRDHLVIVSGRNRTKAQVVPSNANRHNDAMAESKSELAVDLALSLSRTESVVLSHPDISEEDRDKLWRAGVVVIAEDMSMPEVLAEVGAKRARMLVAMRDHFADNIVVTRAAVSPSLGNPRLECKCLLEPLEVKRKFRLDDYFESTTLPRIRIFNKSELIARRILRDHPPDTTVALTDQRVHVLLVGLGAVGQSIMLQIARIGHYRSGLKPKVTVLDRNVEVRWKELQKSHPAIADLLLVETEEVHFEDVGQKELDRWLQDEIPINIVYVCTKNEIANLRIARTLLKEMSSRQGTPADVVVLDPPGGCVLSEFASHGTYHEHFHLFSLVKSEDSHQQSPIVTGILSEMDDAVARMLHEEYCAEDDRACAVDSGRKPADANRPWVDLPETYRDANRSVADHFDVKLRAVGCKLVPAGQGIAVVWEEEEMELLARMEHDRWWSDRALDGWTLAPERNNLRKQHPDMVPYDQLSDAVKRLDRDSIVKMRTILARSGKVVVRC